MCRVVKLTSPNLNYVLIIGTVIVAISASRIRSDNILSTAVLCTVSTILKRGLPLQVNFITDKLPVLTKNHKGILALFIRNKSAMFSAVAVWLHPNHLECTIQTNIN